MKLTLCWTWSSETYFPEGCVL